MVEPSVRFEEVRIPLPATVHGLDAVSGVLGIPEWWPTGSRVGIVLAQSTQKEDPLLENLQRGLTERTYLTLRFHLQIRIFPLWQLTATVFALLAIEAFILFWIDGVAGNPPVGLARWTQVLTGAVLWPLFMAIMDRIRERIEYRDPTFT